MTSKKNPLRRRFAVLFFSWRALLFLIPLIASVVLPYRAQSEFTSLSAYSQNPSLKHFQWLSAWANFDGVHYLGIAGRGYETDGRFFPVYPVLIRGLSWAVGEREVYSLGQYVIGLGLAHLFFVAALLVMYRLVRTEYSAQTAAHTILWVLVFPASFFLVSVYAESLFLLLTLLSFWCARQKRWLWAAVFGAALSATRLPGVFIFPALLVEFLHQEPIIFHRHTLRWSEVADVSRRIWPIFLVPLGLISFVWFNYYTWGDWLYFAKMHADLGNSRSVTELVFPGQTVWRYLKILVTVSAQQYEWWVALLELGSFILGTICLAWAWMKKLRPSYFTFALLCFALPTLSGTFTGLPRYVMSMFPIFIMLGSMKNKKAVFGLRVLSVGLLVLLTMLFSRGYFVA